MKQQPMTTPAASHAAGPQTTSPTNRPPTRSILSNSKNAVGTQKFKHLCTILPSLQCRTSAAPLYAYDLDRLVRVRLTSPTHFKMTAAAAAPETVVRCRPHTPCLLFSKTYAASGGRPSQRSRRRRVQAFPCRQRGAVCRGPECTNKGSGSEHSFVFDALVLCPTPVSSAGAPLQSQRLRERAVPN